MVCFSFFSQQKHATSFTSYCSHLESSASLILWIKSGKLVAVLSTTALYCYYNYYAYLGASTGHSDDIKR